MRRIIALAVAFAGIAAIPAAQAQDRKTPYWASISAGQAMMRTGPGKNYPATWLYQRADLPVKVVEVYPSWRKIQDPGGTTGWMLVNLLSDTRTAIVRGESPAPLHEAPRAESKIRYRAEPGVVGRLSECTVDWCRFDVGKRGGFIRTGNIWGVDPGESF